MFPDGFLGTEVEVPTLALVVPDVKDMSQILIGTNSLDVLYSSYLAKNESRPHSTLPGYRVVLQILEVRRWQAGTGASGWVKMKGNAPEVVPEGGTVVLYGLMGLSM